MAELRCTTSEANEWRQMYEEKVNELMGQAAGQPASWLAGGPPEEWAWQDLTELMKQAALQVLEKSPEERPTPCLDGKDGNLAKLGHAVNAAEEW